MGGDSSKEDPSAEQEEQKQNQRVSKSSERPRSIRKNDTDARDLQQKGGWCSSARTNKNLKNKKVDPKSKIFRLPY